MKHLPVICLIAVFFLSILPGLSYAQTTAYFPNFGDDDVKRVFTSDESNFASVAVCDEPYGAAVTPNGGNLLITCEVDNSVVLIPTESFTNTGAQLAITLEDPPKPRGVAVESRGLFAYVANYGNNKVTEINISTRTHGRTIEVGKGPWGVAAFYDPTDTATKVYVTNHDENSLSVITLDDENTEPVVSTFQRFGDGPLGVALTPDGNFLYVANKDDNEVVVFDTQSETITKTIRVGTEPWGVAMASSGDFVFVTNNGGNNVSVITTASGAVSSYAVGNEPTGVAAPINGDFAYVVNQEDNSVSKVTTTGTVTLIGEGELNGAFSLGAFIGGSPPAAPSELEATTESSGRISLKWTDNATDTLGFKIERREDEEEKFVQVAKVEKTETTYTDESLARGTAYKYRVRAFNETADSAFSETAEATTGNERFTWCFIHTLSSW